MSTVLVAAPTAQHTAILNARKLSQQKRALRETKGTGLTFGDLSDAQIAEGVRYATLVWKKNATSKQKQQDLLSDAIGEALYAIYKGNRQWDSARGAFHVFFAHVVYSCLTHGRPGAELTESYSYNRDEDENGGRAFTFSSAADNADGEASAASILALIRLKLDARENQILDLRFEDWSDEDAAELLDLSHGAYRKALHGLRTKVKSLGFSF